MRIKAEDLEKSLATPGLTRKLESLIKKKMCISMTDPPGFSLFELVDPLILEIMTPRFIKPPQCGEYGLFLEKPIAKRCHSLVLTLKPT